MKFITDLMWKLKPFVIWVDETFTLPGVKKKVSGVQYYQWRDKIHPGHVFLTGTIGVGSNLLNPSEIGHGAIYFGRGLKSFIEEQVARDDNFDVLIWQQRTRLKTFLEKNDIKDDICYVIESVAKGCVATDLISFLTSKDQLIMVEPEFTDKEGMKKAAQHSVNFLGLPYDYGFAHKNNAKYCFETVANSYEATNDIKLKRVEYRLFWRKVYDIFLSDTFLHEPHWKTIISWL